jgi:NAD(P)-dependent dehydrogenase (short-subunit alcohol dehydrogenase family)
MTGALIIGAGPGLGAAIAHRFARAALPITLIARSRPTVEAVARTLEPLDVPVLALTADTADEAGLRSALDTARNEYGAPDALIYNAGLIRRDAPGELSTPDHLHAWSVNVLGALTAATHLAPAMADNGGGSILITGGMPVPDARYTSLSLGKAGVRALTQILHQQYEPGGVHAATVTVYGDIAPGTAFDPDEIAEHYWRLHTQPRDEWQVEVAYRG